MSDQSNPKDSPYGDPASKNDLIDSLRQQPDQQTNQQNTNADQATANSNSTDGYNNYDPSNQQYTTNVNNGQNQQVPYNNQYQQPGQQNFQPNQPQYQQYQQPPQQNFQQSSNYNNQPPYNGQAQNGNYPNYQNNPYQQPPGVYRTSKTNTKSIIALVLGIASICVPYIGFFIGIAGIILSAMALKEIPRKQEEGKGLAIGGLVTSILGTLIYGVLLIFVVGILIFAFDSSSNIYY